MKTKPDWYYTQSAVVPYRLGEQGIEVLLITTRKRKRWIIPKGIVEPDLSAPASAAKEALEEAGVRGQVGTDPIAHYEYVKWGGICRVEVFPLKVEEQLDEWLEMGFRERRWVSLDEAAALVEQEQMREVLRRFPLTIPANSSAVSHFQPSTLLHAVRNPVNPE